MASDPTPLSYHPIKDGRLRVAFRGRHVVTLSGVKAQRLASRLEGADADRTQLLLAKATEQLVIDAGVEPEQVHHGDDVATWHVMERAVARGHGIRVGLEDTTVLPDGRRPAGNGELVSVAAEMLGA